MSARSEVIVAHDVGQAKIFIGKFILNYVISLELYLEHLTKEFLQSRPQNYT
jgi:hypothetical protein